MEQRQTKTRALIILLALMLTCGVLAVVGGYQLLNRPRSLVPTLALPADLFPEPTPTIYPSEVTVIEWWVEDLDSTNGTFLNQIQVEEPMVITSGDDLRCGRINIQIKIETLMPQSRRKI